MDTQQLLSASVLDIIFDGRNKEYGAYCLRKEYNGRLKKAMLTTGAAVGLIIIMLSFKNKEESSSINLPVNDTVRLVILPQDELPVIILPKPVAPPPMVRSVRFTSPPLLIRDKDVSPDDAPPENSSLDNANINVFSQDGPETGFDIVPPQGTSNGVVGNVAAARNIADSVFIGVEIQSSYPGGPKAWARFLNKTFVYPQNAVNNGIRGTVVVKFIVDQSGSASSIEAVTGPDELKAEAIRVIKKSGKWNPAIQNGRMVKSYKEQPIIFILAGD